MEYEIVYARQFIKLPDGRIVPMILHGSSGDTEIANGRKRLARYWHPYNMPYWCNYKIAFTPEELIELNQQWLTKTRMYYIHSRWYGGKSWLTYIKNGIKKAKTLEELGWQGEMSACITVYTRGYDIPEKMYVQFIRTSEQLVEYINAYDERVRARTSNEAVYAELAFLREKFFFPKPPRQPQKPLTDFYVVKFNYDGYIRKITKWWLRRTYNVEYAKKFKTKKAAESWLRKLKIEFRFKGPCTLHHFVKKGNGYEELPEAA